MYLTSPELLQCDEFLLKVIQRLVATLQPEQIILFGASVEYTAQQQDGPVLLLVAPDGRLNFNLKDWEAQAQSCLADLNGQIEIVVTKERLTRSSRKNLQGTLSGKIWTEGKILYEKAVEMRHYPHLHGWDDEKVYFHVPNLPSRCVSAEPELMERLVAVCQEYYGIR